MIPFNSIDLETLEDLHRQAENIQRIILERVEEALRVGLTRLNGGSLPSFDELRKHGACFVGRDASAAYTWKGVPFLRTSWTCNGLEITHFTSDNPTDCDKPKP